MPRSTRAGGLAGCWQPRDWVSNRRNKESRLFFSKPRWPFFASSHTFLPFQTCFFLSSPSSLPATFQSCVVVFQCLFSFPESSVVVISPSSPLSVLLSPHSFPRTGSQASYTMLATRQLLGVAARSRAVVGLPLRRGMATVTDSPLDRKVSVVLFFFSSTVRVELRAA